MTIKTQQTVTSAKARIERAFDAEAVHELKATAGRDLTVGGPELAAQAIEAGLIDAYHLFLVAVVVGGGKRSLLDNDVRNVTGVPPTHSRGLCQAER